MKKLYTLLTALVLAAAPKAMAVTVDDLVGEYTTATEGKTKLSAGGLGGTFVDFEKYTTTIEKVDDATILINNFANCNVKITAKVNLEAKTLEITDKTFPLSGIGFSFRPYAENDGKITQVVEGTITGSFNDDGTEIKIGKYGMFFGNAETSGCYCYGSSTLTPKQAEGAPLKTFSATYTNEGWEAYPSGTCNIAMYEDYFLLKDYPTEGKSVKFTYNAGTQKISMKDPVYTYGSPSYVNPGEGAWYVSMVINDDALAFSPNYKLCSYSIDENGGKMLIYADYYSHYKDLKPKAVFTATIEWGTVPSGIDDIDAGRNTDAAAQGIYSLQGIRMNAANLKKGIYVINGKKVAVK